MGRQTQADDVRTDLSTYTRDPTVLGGEAEDDASLERWQNYGQDRLYLNAANSGTGPIPGTANCYLDLQTGEAVMEIDDTYGGKDSHELMAEVVEKGVVRIENGNETHVLTIDLFGDGPETGEEA